MAGNGVNVGHGNISISPTLVPGFAGILQAQLNHLRPQPTIHVGVQVDQRGLNGLNRQVNSTSGAAGGLRTAFTAAFAALSARSLLQANNNLSGISSHFTALAAAATSVTGAITPVLGLVGGLGAGLAVAGAGIGAFAALAAPQISKVTDATKNVSAAQDAYNTAIATGNPKAAQKALQDRQAALAGLTPLQRQATLATLQLRDAFKQQSNALAPITLGLYTNGVKTLTGLLPALTPVAKAAGTALQNVFAQAKGGLDTALSPDGGLGAFLNVVKEQIGPTVQKLALIFVHLGSTISFVFQRAVPVMQPALDVIVHLTGALANAAGGTGLIDFFAKVKPLLIPLQAAIQSVVAALGAFIKAAIPLAGPVLGAVNAVADALKALFNSAQFQAFVNNIGNAIGSLTPIFAALVGPIGNVLATISGQVAQLAPTLVPVITQFANIFGQVLVGLSPLLPLFVQLAGILVSFLPILYPLIAAFRDAMVPILHAVGSILIAIQPSVGAFVQAIVALAQPLGNLIAALAPVITELINGFLPVLTAILQAMLPLMPVITLFVQQLGGALVQAMQILLPALLPLIPPLGQLVMALLQLFIAAVQPLLPVIVVLAQLLAAMVPVLIPLINAFTWFVNLIRPIAPLLLGLISPFYLIVGVVTLLVRIWTWAWNTIIFPIIRAAAPLFIWLFQNVIQPAFNGIRTALGAVGAAFSWVWNTVLHPVLSAFAAVAKVLAFVLIAIVFAPIKAAWLGLTAYFRFLWDTILHPVFSAVAAVARFLWNNVLKPVFGAIGTAWGALSGALGWVWDNVIHPVFHAFGAVVDAMKRGFGAAVDGIKSIWNSLKRIFAEPLNAVIYPIVRNFAHAVDAVTDFALNKRPLQAFENIANVHFARGGVIPGNHNRDDVPFYGTPGEVVVPKPVVNAAGGPNALMAGLGFGPHAGGPGSHFLLGGHLLGNRGFGDIAHDVTHNPLTDAVGTAVHAAGGAAKKVGGAVFNAGEWALDKAAGLLRAGAADAFDLAYKAMSSPLYAVLGHGTVPQMFRGGVDSIEQSVVGWIRGREASDNLLGGDPISWDGGSNTVGLIEMLARGLPGGSAMTVTSTTGGRHASGSYHGLGEAVDFSNGTGNTPQMLAFDQAWAAKYGSSLAELIYTAPGSVFVKDGKGVPGSFYSSVLGEHVNHVHVAISPESIARGHQGFHPFANAGGPAGDGNVVQQVHAAAAARGWGGQLGALDYIIGHESSWNPNARNPSSTASGLFQLLYGGSGSVASQIANGFSYISQRYGNPDNAQRFWASHHWYDNGGYLQPGLTLAYNGTNRPEPVFTGAQFDAMSEGTSGGSVAMLTELQKQNDLLAKQNRLLAAQPRAIGAEVNHIGGSARMVSRTRTS